MNIRNSIDIFHVVVFPSKKGIMPFLEIVLKVATSSGMRVEFAYTHYTEKLQRRQGSKVFFHGLNST